MKRIFGVIIFACCFYLCIQVVQPQITRDIKRPCVPQPFGADQWTWENFDSTQTRELKAYIEYLEVFVIDKIYENLCSYGANELQCSLFADFIEGCLHDTLFVDHQAIEIRDRAHGGPASLIFYEDSTDDSNYASITVSRDPDSLELEESYQLVLPKDDGNLNEDRSGPGISAGQLGIAWTNGKTANSVLFSDGTGQAYWSDHNWMPRWMGDTLMSDTTNGVGNGNITILSDGVEFKFDTVEARGQWQRGTGSEDVCPAEFYESLFNGTNYFAFQACEDMDNTVVMSLPDQQNEYYRATLMGNDSDDMVWGPNDNIFILRGTDSVLGTIGQDVIYPFQTAVKPSGVTYPYRTYENRLVRVELEWLNFNGANTMGTTAGESKIYGAPPLGSARRDSLQLDSTSFFGDGPMVLSGVAVTNQDGMDFKTDTSFVVDVPVYGSDDTVLVYMWKVIGTITNWDGENSDCNSIP